MGIANGFATAIKTWGWAMALILLSSCTPVSEDVSIRADAERIFSEARSAVSVASESIDHLPPGADGREARDALRSDLDELQVGLSACARLLREDRLAEATKAGLDLRRQAEAIVRNVRGTAAAWTSSPPGGTEAADATWIGTP